jgi:phospholipid/cholesterol/gamma-HCH transport system substrate-binding protein
VSIDPGGAGELLKPGGTITQTESPPDLGELIGKYAFGDIEKGSKEKK